MQASVSKQKLVLGSRLDQCKSRSNPVWNHFGSRCDIRQQSVFVTFEPWPTSRDIVLHRYLVQLPDPALTCRTRWHELFAPNLKSLLLKGFNDSISETVCFFSARSRQCHQVEARLAVPMIRSSHTPNIEDDGANSEALLLNATESLPGCSAIAARSESPRRPGSRRRW